MSTTLFVSTEHEKPPRAAREGENVVPELETVYLQKIAADHGAYTGVEAAEAASKVYGRYSKWVLYVSIALAAYYFSLEHLTTPIYFPFAASAYGKHNLISAIHVAQAVTVACGRPVIAKVADVWSRTQACVLVVMFFVIGFIVAASAHGIKSLTAGSILRSIGATGLELIVSVIIADVTPLKWRGAALSVMVVPFIVNAFIGPTVATEVNEHLGWRWGYGMFAIIVCAFLAPLVLTLLWAERKAKIFGLTPEVTRWDSDDSLLFKGRMFCQQLDLVGLVLAGASVALILLPLTLAINAKGGWHNPSMIAMVVVGGVLIPITALWEIKFAKRPFIARRLLTNRTVIFSLIIPFFNYFILNLTLTYLYSFILVTKPWSLLYAAYFTQTQAIALPAFAILSGVMMRWLHSYKLLLVVGSGIRLVGVALMIHSRGAQGSVVEIVWTQILQGIGGGFSSTCCLVSSQASVSHLDMAIATAWSYMSSDIGSAVGDAVAGAIWTNTMPQKLAKHLPDVNATYRAELFGSITLVTALPYDDPIRQGVIFAYSDVMKIISITATCIATIPLALSFFIPDCYLGDKQSAVETADLKVEQGEPLPATLEMNEMSLRDENYTGNRSA